MFRHGSIHSWWCLLSLSVHLGLYSRGLSLISLEHLLIYPHLFSFFSLSLSFSLPFSWTVSDIPISIDTRHAAVAKAAVQAGADIVNDVSGGQFDADMLGTVAKLNVPMVLMHMRGTPETMQSMTDYSDVVEEVCAAMNERSRAAEEVGIPRWMQILDPGIGFAKDLEGNLSLLKHFRKLQEGLGGIPLLLGTSRKGFIGKVTGETVAAERDWGTVASCVAAICIRTSLSSQSGCHILRVHNVKGMKQATRTMDAILRAD